MIKGINTIPIYIDHNNFLSKEDLEKIKNIEYNYVEFVGSYFSKNLNILDEFPEIKKMFFHKLKIFEEEVIGGLSSSELYIIHSWIAETRKNGWHTKHKHHNSLFSAVYYISVPEESYISFHHENFLFKDFNFHLPNRKITEYNSNLTKIKIKTGDFILFPSWLEHEVDQHLSEDVRTVLAANFFIKGNIGYESFILPVNLNLK